MAIVSIFPNFGDVNIAIKFSSVVYLSKFYTNVSTKMHCSTELLLQKRKFYYNSFQLSIASCWLAETNLWLLVFYENFPHLAITNGMVECSHKITCPTWEAIPTTESQRLDNLLAWGMSMSLSFLLMKQQNGITKNIFCVKVSVWNNKHDKKNK